MSVSVCVCVYARACACMQHSYLPVLLLKVTVNSSCSLTTVVLGCDVVEPTGHNLVTDGQDVRLTYQWSNWNAQMMKVYCQYVLTQVYSYSWTSLYSSIHSNTLHYTS